MDRHEQAEGIIAQVLEAAEGVQIQLEPLMRGSQRRNEIRVIGSRANGMASQKSDLAWGPDGEGGTSEVMKGWKAPLGEQAFSFMLKRLSLCLIKARTRTFEF